MIFNERNMLLQSSDYPSVLIRHSFGLGDIFKCISPLFFSTCYWRGLVESNVQTLALPSRCVSDSVILSSVGYFRLILAQRR